MHCSVKKIKMLGAALGVLALVCAVVLSLFTTPALALNTSSGNGAGKGQGTASDPLVLDGAGYSNGVAAAILSALAKGGGKGGNEIAITQDQFENLNYDDMYGQNADGTGGDSSKKTGQDINEILSKLYGNHYLLTAKDPVTTGNGVIDFFGNLFASIGSFFCGTSKTGEHIYDSSMLDGGIAGINMYRSGLGITATIAGISNIASVPTLMGFNPSIISEGTMDEDTVDGVSNTSWATGLFKTLFSGLGLDVHMFDTLRFVVLAVVAGVFLIIVMKVLSSARRKGVHSVKSWGLRIVVIVFSPLLAYMLAAVVNGMQDMLSNTNDMAQKTLSADYIVSTIDFASATNLDLDPIWNTADGSCAPTLTNIQTLNRYLSDKLGNNWADAGKIAQVDPQINDDDNFLTAWSKNLFALIVSATTYTGIKTFNNEDPAEMLSQLKNGEQLTVRDYYSRLASLQEGNYWSGGNTVIAAQWTRGNSYDTYAKSSSRSSEDAQTMWRPNFLYKHTSEETSQQTDANSSIKDEDGEPIAAKDVLSQVVNYTNETFNFGLTMAAKMSVSRFQWNSPETYIYGAQPAGSASTSTSSVGNFIDKAGNDASKDPNTGSQPTGNENVSVETENGSLSSGSKITKQSELSKATAQQNSLYLALNNKYMGIMTGTVLDSFSTQSVAFLLQSTYSDGTLHYYGWNAPTDDANGSTDTVGAKFNKYVIPYTDDADIRAKISTLGTTWVTIGYCIMILAFSLFRTPIFGAIVKQFKGFFKAAFTGDVFSMFEYAAYYLSVRCSFLAVSIALIMVWWIIGLIGYIINGTPFQVVATDIGTQGGGVPVWGGIMSLFGSLGSFLGGISNVLFSIMIAFALSWPSFEMPIGNKGRLKKVGILQAMVMIPYLIAESVTSNFQRYRERLYGTGLAHDARRTLSGKVRKLSAKESAQVAVEPVKKVAKAGAMVAATAVTGGSALAVKGGAMAAKLGAKGFAGKAAQKLGAKAATNLAGKANPLAVKKDASLANGAVNALTGKKGNMAKNALGTTKDGARVNAKLDPRANTSPWNTNATKKQGRSQQLTQKVQDTKNRVSISDESIARLAQAMRGGAALGAGALAAHGQKSARQKVDDATKARGMRKAFSVAGHSALQWGRNKDGNLETRLFGKFAMQKNDLGQVAFGRVGKDGNLEQNAFEQFASQVKNTQNEMIQKMRDTQNKVNDFVAHREEFKHPKPQNMPGAQNDGQFDPGANKTRKGNGPGATPYDARSNADRIIQELRNVGEYQREMTEEMRHGARNA